MMLGLSVMAQPVGALKCPDGSVRAGSSVEVASQCNVPEDKDTTNGDANGLIGNIVNFLIGITAVIAIFVIIIAGIQMATSQGDASKVGKARNMILYAVVGLVIAIVAYAIVNFVLKNVFGVGA